MQGNRQRHRKIKVCQFTHFLHETTGRKRDISQSHTDPFLQADKTQKTGHFLKVVQRFSRSHKNDMTDASFLSKITVDTNHFSDELGSGQIPYTPLQGARAERTSHPASHLGGNAQGITVVVVHQHAFHTVAILHGKKIFHCVIHGRLIA